MPRIIPWKIEIQKIVGSCKPAQAKSKTPSQPIAGHNGIYLSSQTTWEAEIGRSQSRLGKKVCENTSQQSKAGMVVCACHPSDSEKLKIGSWSKPT
jgi:hypothetical protein